MVLFSLFVLEFQVASLPVLLDGLVLLPVLDTLLQPFFHETCISCDFVDLSCPHFLKHTLMSLSFFTITLLCKGILPNLLIVKLLEVTLH